MGRSLLVLLFMAGLSGISGRVHAQDEDSLTHMVRIYEDDDCINIFGNVSDNAYSNGTRLDYFYESGKASRFFLNKLMPHAGTGSRNVYGWGIMQIMYTPDDLLNKQYQPHDYPYSGSLFATHTLYSYNAERKYSFQTELVGGVIGPASLAKPIQRFVHRLEGFDIPQGWDHQFSNDVLFNVNFTAEKQLFAAGHGFDVIGGARAFAGTMQDAVGIYPMIRFGNMRPYFDGFFSQYTGTKKKGQFYFFVKPEVQLVFFNALVQGGVFTQNPNLHNGAGNSKPADGSPNPGMQPQATALTPDPLPYPGIKTLQGSFSYGAVLALGHFGISLTQTSSSTQLKGLYCHQTGNVSLYFCW